ncbi:MAG: 4Fe-4S binding protein [Candidatus Aegiribacteria sp.]|nr:4Fe-4S binding protein [Candidatus Aegiribacteria sp.]
MGTDHKHRLCTYEEAEKAIRDQSEFYVNECFCRGPAKAGETSWDYCGHDVNNCMSFREPSGEDAGYEYVRISQREALDKFENWKQQGNFFRFMVDDDWLCFCCGCGCAFFRDENGQKIQDTCENAPFIEKTDLDKCTLCGTCVDVCAYGARSIESGEMLVDGDKCPGCSACEYACPTDAIKMVLR